MKQLTSTRGWCGLRRELVYLFGMQARRSEVDAEFKALSRLTALNHHDLFTWGITHFADWAPDIADDLESFVKADPGDRHSRLALANLLVDVPDAESQVERALAPLSADDAEASALRITLKLNRGRIDEATALLDRAASGPSQACQAPGPPRTHRGRSRNCHPPFSRGSERRTLRPRLAYGTG